MITAIQFVSRSPEASAYEIFIYSKPEYLRPSFAWELPKWVAELNFCVPVNFVALSAPILLKRGVYALSVMEANYEKVDALIKSNPIQRVELVLLRTIH